MNEYKSQLFASGNPGESFFTHLSELANIPTGAFQEICTVWPPSRAPLSEKTEKELLAVAKKTGVSLVTFGHGIAWASAVHSQSKEKNDDIDGILEDAAIAGRLTDVQRKTLIANMRTYSHVLEKRMSEEDVLEGGLQHAFPLLDHIHTATTSFMTFEKEYSTVDDQEESYDPKGCKQEFVTLVQIDTDCFGKKEQFSFAVRENELTRLINRLQLARKQLVYVKGPCGKPKL